MYTYTFGATPELRVGRSTTFKPELLNADEDQLPFMLLPTELVQSWKTPLMAEWLTTSGGKNLYMLRSWHLLVLQNGFMTEHTFGVEWRHLNTARMLNWQENCKLLCQQS